MMRCTVLPECAESRYGCVSLTRDVQIALLLIQPSSPDGCMALSRVSTLTMMRAWEMMTMLAVAGKQNGDMSDVHMSAVFDCLNGVRRVLGCSGGASVLVYYSWSAAVLCTNASRLLSEFAA